MIILLLICLPTQLAYQDKLPNQADILLLWFLELGVMDTIALPLLLATIAHCMKAKIKMLPYTDNQPL